MQGSVEANHRPGATTPPLPCQLPQGNQVPGVRQHEGLEGRGARVGKEGADPEAEMAGSGGWTVQRSMKPRAEPSTRDLLQTTGSRCLFCLWPPLSWAKGTHALLRPPASL